MPSDGSTVGSAIVRPGIRHRDVRAISFTGSVETGKWILGESARDMKRVSPELGGKNPIILMDDANMDLAIDGVLWGAFRKRVPNDHREGPGWGMMLHPADDSVIRFVPC